jgi:hypothetical protein
MSSDEYTVLRLRAVADADPGALARVLERFQNLNLLPRKVTAELSTGGLFHVEIDIGGIPEHMMSIVTDKIAASPCIHSARWHHLVPF